jgi:hypothetical protein
MLESQNFLDVQLVFTSTAVLGDFVDEDCDLGDWAIHPVEAPTTRLRSRR